VDRGRVARPRRRRRPALVNVNADDALRLDSPTTRPSSGRSRRWRADRCTGATRRRRRARPRAACTRGRALRRRPRT
jgi:hypothetical protein